MQITLCAYEKELGRAFEAAAEGLTDVHIHHGSIFDVDCDAMVSPANSFGFMDGGIDQKYLEFFGIEIQERVRSAILRDRHGELLVGDALIVPTDHADVPYLIAAPTMRVPMQLGAVTVAPYHAARAVILLIRHGTLPSGNPVSSAVQSVAFPGLGTGIGRVPFKVAGHQMCEAIRRHRDGQHQLPNSWSEASFDHQMLYGQSPRDLQR